MEDMRAGQQYIKHFLQLGDFPFMLVLNLM
jgi:hypothetical protein